MRQVTGRLALTFTEILLTVTSLQGTSTLIDLNTHKLNGRVTRVLHVDLSLQ